MKKRILSWALVLCMVLALLPGAALAADDSAAKPHHHIVETDAAVAPTCTETGLTEGSHCSVCGKVFVAQETLKALGHQHAADAQPIAHKDATCTEDGFNTYRCSVCGLSYSEVIEAHHSVETWNTAEEPTCETDGSRTGFCSVCKQNVSEAIPALKHTFDDTPAVVVKPATCTEAGSQTRYCTVCKENVTEEIPALEHDFGDWKVTKAATCTEEGVETGVCSHCNVTTTREIPTLTYNEVPVAAVAPTCTESGLTEGSKCSVCGEVVKAQEAVPALGHTEYTITVEPTCAAAGKTVTVCLRCEEVLANEVLPKLAHTPVVDEAVAPTCTESGLTGGSHCKVCGEVLVKQEVIPMVAHVFGDWEVTKEATCTTAGSQTRKCTVCGLTETEVIEATGHTHAEDAAPLPGGKAATCTEAGYARYKCDVCGLAYNEPVEATGHNVSNWLVSKKATCTTDGSRTGICDNCKQIITETIPALNHKNVSDGDWHVTVAPTCTEEGLQEAYCPDCNTNISEAIPATGHDYRASVVAPTCTEQGYTKHVCAKCGDSYTDSEVAALGHTYSAWKLTKAATCTEAGQEAAVCVTCGTIEYREIEALGHKVEKWEETKAATCTEAGAESGVCTVCEETVTRELPALGHTEVIDAAVEPTCTTTGLTEGKHCSVCNEVLVAQEVLPALGHKWDDGVVTTAPTATKDGVKTFTCTRCGETKTEAIPATGEKPIDPVTPIDPTTVFTDVSHDWAYPGIEYCYNHGLMAGTSNTTFSPDDALTRGQFVAILWRQLGCPAPKGENLFTDLTQDYYKDAITWAAENKVVYGTSETTFDPDRAITRQELTTMFYRYVRDYLKQDVSGIADVTGFPDYGKVADYAREAMAWAKGVGLISGNEIGGTIYLDPLGAATRAQAATMFMNLCERVLK